jgi:1,6-anhydro-N-acetylmuramate kinase
MSGTSMDGVDAVLVRARGEGFGLHAVEVVGSASAELGGRATLERLASGEAVAPADIARAALDLGEAYAAAGRAACNAAGIDQPDLVCAHGQTVWHRPPLGWQVFNPWPLAAAMGCPVVYDLRGADLAGGGQGAPVTPLADWVLFRSERATRVIVNLGGFCNITVLPAWGTDDGPGGVAACDVCACNQVLDAAARAVLGQGFDPEGSHAARGRADAVATAELRGVLDAQAGAARSLGSGDEAAGWVTRWTGELVADDLLASACAGVGGAIAGGVRRALGGLAADGGVEFVLAGGSAYNRALVAAITHGLGGTVRSIEEIGTGMGPSQREGACFAVLGLLLADGVEITLPGVTGRAGPIPLSGAWIFPNDNPIHRMDRRPRPR